MPTTPFSRATERFRASGVDLNNPPDSVRPGYYPILENVRSYSDGIIQQRNGLSLIAAVSSTNLTPIWTVRRLNDPNSGNYQRIVQTQTNISYGTTTFTRARYNGSDIIVSNNLPITMVPYRPDQAISSWMYMTGNLNMYKIVGNNPQSITVGTVHKVGVAPPTSVGAIAELAGTNDSTAVLDFETNPVPGAWSASDGGAVALTSVIRVDVAAVTITETFFDSGSTPSWACVVPSNMNSTGPGMQLLLGTETCIVYEVYPGSADITAGVTNILYDNRPTNTGTCTITAKGPLNEIRRNAVVRLNGTNIGARGAKRVRVTHVSRGPNNTVSFRCTTGATTVATSDNLQVVPSFRVYSALGGFTTGSVIGSRAIQYTTAATNPITTVLVNNTAIDLTKFTSANNVPISNDDFFHLSVNISDLSKVTQIRVMFNKDNGSFGVVAETANTLTKNYFYRSFTPNDLVAVAKGTQTSQDNRTSIVQRRLINQPADIRSRVLHPELPADFPSDRVHNVVAIDPTDPNSPRDVPSRTQTGSGDGQWSELRWTRGEMQSIGTGQRGWGDVTGFRLEVITTGIVTVQVNSLTLWGGGMLNTTDLGIPYLYRHRYRVSTTGAVSNWGNSLFEGIQASNQSTNVTVDGTAAPEVDTIDIARQGGALTVWGLVGSIANPGATTTIFNDNINDLQAAGAVPLTDGDTNYQPWPVKDKPFSTTATTVAGTALVVSAALPTGLAKGTPMKINGLDTSFRRVISLSALLYEIADCFGALTNATVEIPEPLILAQPLPALWTWNDRGFACGDTRNPGYLYYSNGNSLDGTTDSSFLEITPPSEALINGTSFNGKNYVWSSERMFEIVQIGLGDFLPIEIPGRKGLFARYGLATGERIWFVSRDGIYQTGGGDAISITDDTLRPLFIQEGNPGVAVNGFNPPDFTLPQLMRLSYYDGYLYFVYRDTASVMRCLTYTVRAEKPGWWPDVYLDGTGITGLYGEEGDGVRSVLASGNNAVNANLYQVSGNLDNTGAIPCHVRTQAFDGQDRRALKDFGDVIVEADSIGASISPTAYLNNAATTAAFSPTTLATAVGRTQTILDLSSGQWQEARNLALDLTWSSTSTGAGVVPKLYFWEPSFITLPENSINRATYWDTAGLDQDKFFQGVEIWTDTSNVARTVRVEYDGQASNLADTLTVQHNGHQMKAYAFHPAFIAHNIRLRPTDANVWKTFSYKWIYQPEPPAADRWETQQTSFGAQEFVSLKAAYVALRSTTACSLTVTRTEDGVSNTYTVPTTSGQRARVYVPFVATKGKSFSFVITSTAQGSNIRVYKSNTTVLAKPWASEQAYVDRNPWGAAHGDGAAAI